jgi:SAM-dependent methyltransferase
MAGPTPQFWQEKFATGQTGWDRGKANHQLLAWLDAAELAPCRIAVPGCGAGWEVAELAGRGFDVTAIDYTPAAVDITRALLAANGLTANVVQADVLEFQPGQAVDAIYEQTCLCALHPDHWIAYGQQLVRWLKPGGKLWALFMQVPRPAAIAEGRIEGPPYHCDINAMRALLPGTQWQWPKPPYVQATHPNGRHELGLCLTRI